MDQLLARFLSPHRVVIARQFLRFGTVGFAGLIFDAGTVYASKAWVGLAIAGILGYIVAATVTWWLNRQWTFRGLGDGGSIIRQWAAFMSANFAGFIVNRGIYLLLITFSAFCATYPIFAVMGGLPAGMLFNFNLSRRVVFKAKSPG